MEIQERIKEAEKLVGEQKYQDSAALFEEIADETGNIYCALQTITLNKLLAYSMQGIGAPCDRVCTFADKAIKWAVKLNEYDDVMNSYGDKVRSGYRDACSIKGRALFAEENERCEFYLSKAAALGDNTSRFYLGVFYNDKVSELMNSGKKKSDEVSKYAAKMVELFEQYLVSAQTDEEKERCPIVHSTLVPFYEHGIGIKKDKKRARYHRERS